MLFTLAGLPRQGLVVKHLLRSEKVVVALFLLKLQLLVVLFQTEVLMFVVIGVISQRGLLLPHLVGAFFELFVGLLEDDDLVHQNIRVFLHDVHQVAHLGVSSSRSSSASLLKRYLLHLIPQFLTLLNIFHHLVL